MTRVRIAVPHHLRALAGVGPEVAVEVSGAPTVAAALDALESAHPELRGTIRDQASGRRRAYMRYFACGRDLSHEPDDTPLPEGIVTGAEPLRVLGAIAGGSVGTTPRQ